MRTMAVGLVSAALICGMALQGGCRATHLVYAHNATLGLELTPLNTNEGTSKFVLGYDRETYAVVPGQGDGDKADAMTLAGFSRVYVKGLDEVEFSHLLATGRSAKRFAAEANRDTAKLADVVEGVFERSTEGGEDNR